jgi:hypothetical protein
MMRLLILLMGCGVWSVGYAAAAESAPKRCLHVASYHYEYVWTQKIEDSIRKNLKGACGELETFYLDGKRTPSGVARRAVEAKALIEKSRPDVVIVSDDLAVQNVLQRHFRDSPIPFVFCGLNWSAAEYGLPYANTTGMIEVNAIDDLLRDVGLVVSPLRKGVCIAENTETGRKICSRYATEFAKKNVKLELKFPNSYAGWASLYTSYQSSGVDFVFLAIVHGIPDFDFAKARVLVRERSRKLSVAVYDWMLPISMLALTNLAEEQGDFAAAAARQVLAGVRPSSIPIVVNRKWNLFINEDLANRAGIKFPQEIRRQAELFKE